MTGPDAPPPHGEGGAGDGGSGRPQGDSTTRPTFGDRLMLAAAIIDSRPQILASTPGHVQDQWAAATSEAHGLFADLARSLHAADPHRFPDPKTHPKDDTRGVTVLAAILGCDTPCWHVRSRQTQPAVFDLAGRRASCRRCTRTIQARVIPDDRCDVCHDKVPDDKFWPLAAQMGCAVVIGDMCRSCTLLIHPEMVTS